jgi:hypothetical protein
MADDVLINKAAATIERCVKRAREEYDKNPATFAADHGRNHRKTSGFIFAVLQ